MIIKTSSIVLLCLLLASAAWGDTSATDSRTPPEVAVGTPAGSYALGNLDTFNPYNGSLNIHVPIYKVGGRGEVGYTISAVIQQSWQIVTHTLNSGPGGDPDILLWVQGKSGITTGSKWLPIVPLYSPGVVVSRAAIDTTGGALACPGSSGYSYYNNAALTRLTFIDGIGTEHELVDTATNGQPLTWYTNPPWNASRPNCTATPATAGTDRGKTFRAMDSSDIQFVSDTDVYDSVGFYTNQPSLSPSFTVMSGWLYFPNGTKYRVDEGYVSGIEDRNGNKASTLLGSVGGTITDPLNRQIQVTTYSGAGAGTDTIAYPGVAGTPRQTVVTHAILDSTTLDQGQTLETYDQLFPGYSLDSSLSSATYAPVVIKSITLPDGTSYQFTYTSYGDVASMTLPTGGKIKYGWDTALGSDCTAKPTFCVATYQDANSNPAGVVFRRLLSRTEMSDGTNVSRQTLYSYAFDSVNSRTVTTVTDKDGSGSTFSVVDHHYLGDAADTTDLVGPPDRWYSTPENGKEYLTEISDGTTVFRQVTHNYVQRACVAPEPCWFQTSGGPSVTSLTSATFLHDPNVSSEQTTEGSPSKTVSYSYDANNNVTDEFDTDWDNATTLRHIHTDFNTSSGNIVDLPANKYVYSGGNALLAKTVYHYDETATSLDSGLSTTGHDNTNYPAGIQARGNLTTRQDCLNTSASSCVWLTTTYLYDMAGNLTSVTDANNHTTSYGYADANNSYANVTTATNAYGQMESWAYDFSTSKLTSVTDLNQVQTTYQYARGGTGDPLDRVEIITKASNITSSPVTTNVNAYYTSPTDTNINSDQNIANDQAIHTEKKYDGFGRELTSIIYPASGAISTSKSYDPLGRIETSTNEAGFTTQYAYDPFGRTLSVKTLADSAVTTTCYYPNSACAPAVTSGHWQLTTDQAGNKRQTFTDGLGRISKVIEDPSGLNYITVYSYDALGNLTTVSQSGLIRQFGYDSLSRLVAANNPENQSVSVPPSLTCQNILPIPNQPSFWTTCYSYDSVGNLKTKTDNRSVVTTYNYDPLNRLTDKSYPGSTTPSAAYCYDGIYDAAHAAYEDSVCSSPGNLANAIGHLTMARNANSTTSFTGFDALGRVLAHSQLTAGNTYSFAYAYNLAGGLISETYPSNRTVTTCYDLAGRVSQVGGSCQSLGANASPTPYISGIGTGSGVQYAPQGAPSNYQYGNGVQRTATYNARLQPSNIVDQANSLQLLNMTWYWYPQNGPQSVNNGNLRNLSYFEGGPGYPTVVSFNQSFTYDTLNRLSGVSDSGYSRIFNYDAYGNMYVPPAAATPPGWTGIAPSGYMPSSVSAYNGLNQLNAAGYDGNGNQVSFNDSQLTYDAENRQTQMVYGGTTENYTYDADGKRVSKNAAGGPQSVFVYDAMGHMAAEYSTATESSPCTTCYLSADHLGSARLVTDQRGNVVARHDYLPFGEEIAANTAGRDSHWGPFNDSINQKFTGKERDAESGLDYFGARYYGSALGRFSSPDYSSSDPDPVPNADLYNPQTLNLYSYVGNNPLSRTDPSGHVQVCGAQYTTTDSTTGATTVHANCSEVSDFLFAVAFGHHFVDQSLIRAKGAADSLAGRFFDAWRTGRLAVRGLHRGFTGAHRANSAQIRAIIERLEAQRGDLANWGEAEIKEAVDEIRSAGGDIKTFLDGIEKNNPLVRTVRDDIGPLLQKAQAAGEGALSTAEQAPVVGPIVQGVETACESEPACGLPPE